MTNMLKTAAGLIASFAILGGPAMAEEAHVAAQDSSVLLTAIYAKIDEEREQSHRLVLAKASSNVQLAMMRTTALYAYRPSLNNRFVLAHLEP